MQQARLLVLVLAAEEEEALRAPLARLQEHLGTRAVVFSFGGSLGVDVTTRRALNAALAAVERGSVRPRGRGAQTEERFGGSIGCKGRNAQWMEAGTRGRFGGGPAHLSAADGEKRN